MSDEKFFVHPSAFIEGDVQIGDNTKIWHFSKFLGPCSVGKSCVFGHNVVVEKNVHIGDRVRVQNNVSIYSGVTLEDDVFCGPSMVFTNVTTPRSHYPRREKLERTIVRKGASIGANATIVCGVELGAYSMIGAGSVITRDVPEYGLMVGVPGRLVGFVCYCGQKLPFAVDEGQEHTTCQECGRSYTRDGLTVRNETKL